MEAASGLLFFLIPLSLAAVLGVLGLGLYSLAKGGTFAKEHSNKLMRLRVGLQAVALVVIMLFIWARSQSGT
ncbi:MAG: twin transmembrane helix small protein [Pseudomonadota bacterium]